MPNTLELERQINALASDLERERNARRIIEVQLKELIAVKLPGIKLAAMAKRAETTANDVKAILTEMSKTSEENKLQTAKYLNDVALRVEELEATTETLMLNTGEMKIQSEKAEARVNILSSRMSELEMAQKAAEESIIAIVDGSVHELQKPGFLNRILRKKEIVVVPKGESVEEVANYRFPPKQKPAYREHFKSFFRKPVDATTA